MKAFMKIASWRLCDESTALRGVQLLMFGVAVGIFPVALRVLVRMEPSRVELLQGCLLVSGVGVTFVTAGLVIGLMAEQRRR